MFYSHTARTSRFGKIFALLLAFSLCFAEIAFALPADTPTPFSYTAEVAEVEEALASASLVLTEAAEGGETTFDGTYRLYLSGAAKDTALALDALDPVKKSVTFSLTEDKGFVNTSADGQARQQALEQELTTDLFLGISAFILDYPQYFWFNGLNIAWDYERQHYDYGEGAWYWTVGNITVNVAAKDCYAADLPGFVTRMESALETAPSAAPGETRYQSILRFHRWICQNTVYDYDSSGAYSHEPVGVFLSGEAVCEGYAEALKILCDRADIPCMLVIGNAGVPGGGMGGHMWNAVQLEDGNLYLVDATWDDVGEDAALYYFLVGSETVCDGNVYGKTHVATGQVLVSGPILQMPAVSSVAYPEIAGDANGDLVFDGSDLVLCAKALAGWDSSVQKGAADVNGDGLFDGSDLVLCAKALAGWDVTFA